MYRGAYKSIAPNGLPYYYVAGDTVLYQGRIYKVKNPTQKSPLQVPQDWQFIGATEPYSGANPPKNPVENQLWMSQKGTMYIWYKDTNGFQWIEI